MNVKLLVSLLQQRCILDQSLLNRWTLIYNSQYSQSRERLYYACNFFSSQGSKCLKIMFLYFKLNFLTCETNSEYGRYKVKLMAYA